LPCSSLGRSGCPRIGRSFGHGLRGFKESVSGDGPEANADAAPVTAETRALPQRSPAQLEQPAAQPPASVGKRRARGRIADAAPQAPQARPDGGARRASRRARSRLVIMLARARGRLRARLRLPPRAAALAQPAASARPAPPLTFGIAEPFTTSLKVSLYAGFALALPVILWQLWSFLAPAIDPRTERAISGLVLFASGLFVSGVAFAYKLALPAAVHYLTTYDAGFYNIQSAPAATTPSHYSRYSRSGSSSSCQSSCSRSCGSAPSPRPSCAAIAAPATS